MDKNVCAFCKEPFTKKNPETEFNGNKYHKKCRPCEFCKEPFDDEDPRTHFNQKYHKKCLPNVIREQNVKGVRKYRARWGNLIKGGRSEPLGTIDLGMHMLDDPVKEHEQVLKALKQAGLR